MSQVEPLYPADGLLAEDHTRPSLFELLAEEQLRDVLHPVVRYVLSYLAQNYPRYFLRVLNHHEEVFAGLLLLVERYHLKRHNASLSEHFYGLRLAPVNGIPTPRLDALDGSRPPRGLSKKQRWGMLLILVGMPYLRARAQDYYERLGGARNAEDGAEPEIVAVSRKQRLFKFLYPYVNLAFDISLLGYDIAYLFDLSSDYRPWHRALGLRIRRRGEEDESPPSSSPSLLSRLPPLLPPLLLLLKLSQWWYSPTSPRLLRQSTSSSFSGGLSASSAQIHAGILPPAKLPILPGAHKSHLGSLSPGPEDSGPDSEPDDETTTPRDDKAGGGGWAVQIPTESYGLCPICGQKWQNPAVLPSGWVFCWRCGWEAVEGETDGSDSEGEDEVGLGGLDAKGEVKKVEGEGGDERDEGSETGSARSTELEMGDIGDEGVSYQSTNGQGGRKGRKEKRGLRRRGKCPITGVHVGEGQLRRVLV
ncbi:Pex12 amino terminal region-domain-containing protein [Dioszegia hungarica]|uniref:Peroxisome assembly protein 12 n=1 Tax=Dioszegia hungarica TaxID=4972 RepID=A0AA38HGW4_9TREE|nr:Pex12 amino terminal region-domain-containing protein [Dioszegia hungarica]KAI9638709.1 Pex12 amino terminal region-domain-containing protein [Dioszegia hungarica]